MVREIPLTQGKVAVVDDEDLPLLAGYSWVANGRNGAAARIPGGRGRQVKMHRLLLGAPSGSIVDHANGDPYDNRRGNLRLATPAQNAQNQRRRSDNTSGYRGVCFAKNEGKWVARVWADRKFYALGYFDLAEEAAMAYDRAAVRLHGQFARPNFPIGDTVVGTDPTPLAA